MPPLRGEEGGTPEYKYSEEMPACPCGIDSQCLSLFMDEEFDQEIMRFIFIFSNVFGHHIVVFFAFT
jgi:hypothetical protein